ncbi:hypothetical protein QFC21_003559 [Naganishia friedmannii]|uniref:Uncharacterized protein n=1 Tax=Naganishia friedmannii TaxID=89922 RepID=A0ACC2VP09_9TREE|nr:hypothetical protein QFC21_003559 [Naganishia friedmannii]
MMASSSSLVHRHRLRANCQHIQVVQVSFNLASSSGAATGNPTLSVTMHRKAQSTSALSVILSGHAQPLCSAEASSMLQQPVASSSRLSNAPKIPSSRTSARTRISHSRTRSDLTLYSAEAESRSSTPKSSRLDDRSRSSGHLKQLPAMHDGYCTSPTQKHRKRETLSSTEEEDTSGPSDLEYQPVAQKFILRSVESTSATPVIASDTTYRKPYIAPRLGAVGETPRRKEATPKKPKAFFRDTTLENCPAILLSLRTPLNDRLQTLRFIERELAHAFQDSDPLQLGRHSFLSQNLQLPLLATLRTEAADLLRNAPTSTVDKGNTSIKVLDVLLSILQGICLIGVRRNGSFEAEEGTTRNIREALGQEWVVETLIDLLSWSKSIPPPASPTHQILNTLFTIVVYVPSTIPAFSTAGGYEVIAGLLKLVDEKEVKVKAIEFFVYLGSLTTNDNGSDEKQSRIDRADKEETVDVFGTPKPISIIPVTPKSSRRLIQSSYISRKTRLSHISHLP